VPFHGTPGPNNAITDVDGVLVGHTTLISGEGALEVGKGPVRTGVTAILPRGKDISQTVAAGRAVINGTGEMTGSWIIDEIGAFAGPIMLTGTSSVGIVHHATSQWIRDNYPPELWIAGLIPVVTETLDIHLNDVWGYHVTDADVYQALDSAASGPVAEGNVGGGTGMIAYEFKGGTGTASRRVAIDGDTWTVAALVQANYGIRPWFTVLGVPVGQHLTADRMSLHEELGSIIVVIATDAPMLPHQLQRVAKRGSIGIGRCGSPGGNNSGDIFVAFSVANRASLAQQDRALVSADYVNDACFDGLYEGAVQSIEEAIVNAMVAAVDMPTLKLPAGRICRALPHDQLVEVMRRYGRCQ
jgi:D-aminopeptidase